VEIYWGRKKEAKGGCGVGLEDRKGRVFIVSKP
jgi:hypothetical protein